MGLWGTRSVAAVVLTCPFVLGTACADDATSPAGAARSNATPVDAILSSFGVQRSPQAHGANLIR
ncbi:MAG: hypothetical protein IT377_04950, partial [Polyangiaceae bacterium]|nr:hypothetical protein [Polyangiaceae bacterium]